jgi:putative hydrolase of HD superfamily
VGKINSIFKVVALTNQFRQVKRTINAVGEGRLENDSEHSYQLAMLAWYIVESGCLPLDKELVIKYCLVHDLVEAYAGDVDPHTSSENDKDAKAHRERQALSRIEEEFQECPSIATLIHQYERKVDSESRFIYALDKIQPVLNVYLDSGDYYRKNNITFEQWTRYNKEKVGLSPEVAVIFKELLEILEQSQDLFASG